MNYYNEIDPKMAAWIRELIKAGLIPDGVVDERSIKDVKATELSGYTQCHFFAGIAGWSFALRLAGWPDDRQVWTGSCPCQPFSAAGKQMGSADSRHLFPAFRRLIARCQPAVVFGEQVASGLGREWFARVRLEMATLGYATRASDLCAASVGAPHIRQRLYWVADRNSERFSGRTEQDFGSLESEQPASRRPDSVRCSNASGLEYTESDGRKQRRPEPSRGCSISGCSTGGMAYAERWRREMEVQQCTSGVASDGFGKTGKPRSRGAFGELGNTNGSGFGEHGGAVAIPQKQPAAELPSNLGFWSNFELIQCTDGKQRRIESGSFPLAHGISGRVGLLRGYGNAIVPQVAAEFIKTYLT